MIIHIVKTISAPDEPAGLVFVGDETTTRLLTMQQLLTKVAEAARAGNCVMLESYNGEEVVIIHQAPYNGKR